MARRYIDLPKWSASGAFRRDSGGVQEAQLDGNGSADEAIDWIML